MVARRRPLPPAQRSTRMRTRPSTGFEARHPPTPRCCTLGARAGRVRAGLGRCLRQPRSARRRRRTSPARRSSTPARCANRIRRSPPPPREHRRRCDEGCGKAGRGLRSGRPLMRAVPTAAKDCQSMAWPEPDERQGIAVRLRVVICKRRLVALDERGVVRLRFRPEVPAVIAGRRRGVRRWRARSRGTCSRRTATDDRGSWSTTERARSTARRARDMRRAHGKGFSAGCGLGRLERGKSQLRSFRPERAKTGHRAKPPRRRPSAARTSTTACEAHRNLGSDSASIEGKSGVVLSSNSTPCQRRPVRTLAEAASFVEVRASA